jgi:iron complex transport system substrate-binding protein
MIELAGGASAVGTAGEKSRTETWEAIGAAAPDVVVVMPCGLHADEALAEAERHRDELERTGAGACHAVDAAASFSRPGPRLVEGVELLAHVLHPDLVAPPTGVGWRTLWD